MAEKQKLQIAALPPNTDFENDVSRSGLRGDVEKRDIVLKNIQDSLNILYERHYERRILKQKFDISSYFRQIKQETQLDIIGQSISEMFSTDVEKYFTNDNQIDQEFDRFLIGNQTFGDIKRKVYQGTFEKGGKEASLYVCIFKVFKGKKVHAGDLRTLGDKELRQFHTLVQKLLLLYSEKNRILTDVFSRISQDEYLSKYIQDVEISNTGDNTSMLLPGIDFTYASEVYRVIYRYNFDIISISASGKIEIFSTKGGTLMKSKDIATVSAGNMILYRALVGGRVRFFTRTEDNQIELLAPFGLENIDSVELISQRGDYQCIKLSGGGKSRIMLISLQSDTPSPIYLESSQFFTDMVEVEGSVYLILKGLKGTVILDTERGFLLGVGAFQRLYDDVEYLENERKAIVRLAGVSYLVDMKNGTTLSLEKESYIASTDTPQKVNYSQFRKVEHRMGVLKVQTLDNTVFYASTHGEQINQAYGKQIFS